MSSPDPRGPLDRARTALRNSKLSHVLVALLTAVLAAGVTIVIDNPGPDHHHAVTVHVGQISSNTVTKQLGGPGHDTVTLSPTAQSIVAAQAVQAAAPTAETGLHESSPPTPTQIRAAQNVAPPGAPSIPQHLTDASPTTAGCTSKFVRNYSHRALGAKVELGVIHWTGSNPTRGSTAGGLAIVRWFDTPASQVSSNYITDQDGRCWYIVPEALKAWTQTDANSWAVSDEITNIGTAHPLFQTTAARQAVIRLLIGWHHRWRIPYVHGRVNGSCVPTQPGFLSHKDLGPCGGGHPDVGDFDINGLIAQAKAQDGCNTRCRTRKALRAKHQRTHQRIVKNHCPNGGKNGGPILGGYCKTLRDRNAAVHKTAKAKHISLAGTYK